MLGRGLGHRIERVEGVFVGQVGLIGEDFLVDVFAERLQHREIDAAIRSVDGTTLRGRMVDEVEHAITARYGVVLGGQVVQTHQVEQ